MAPYAAHPTQQTYACHVIMLHAVTIGGAFDNVQQTPISEDTICSHTETNL